MRNSYKLNTNQSLEVLRNVATAFRTMHRCTDITMISPTVIRMLAEFAHSTYFAIPNYGSVFRLHGAVIGAMDHEANVIYSIKYPRTAVRFFTWRNIEIPLTTPHITRYSHPGELATDAVFTPLLTMVVPAEGDYYLLRETYLPPTGTRSLAYNVPLDGNILPLKGLSLDVTSSSLRTFMPDFQTTE